jgi:hypothetical protein
VGNVYIKTHNTTWDDGVTPREPVAYEFASIVTVRAALTHGSSEHSARRHHMLQTTLVLASDDIQVKIPCSSNMLLLVLL